MEDYVTWVDTSKLKRTIMQYNDEVFALPCRQSLSLIFLSSSLTTLIFYNPPSPESPPEISILSNIGVTPSCCIRKASYQRCSLDHGTPETLFWVTYKSVELAVYNTLDLFLICT